MKINIKNIVVVLGIFIIIHALAFTEAYYFMIKPIQKETSKVIETALKKETTAIYNEIKKIKTKNGVTDIEYNSSINDTTKKGWIKNIFKNKNNEK